MNRIFIFILCFCLSVVMSAQESAKFHVTYDCEAEYVAGKKSVSVWNLDVGDSTAIFYNDSYREFEKGCSKLQSEGDMMKALAQIKELGQKYSNRNGLQILIDSPAKGKYSYLNDIFGSSMQYVESIPKIDWQMQDSTNTIKGYQCRQAKGTLYGRTWTVWFTIDLPICYGPYLLCGLPGLILAARDDDGCFNFMLAGIEKAQEGTQVSFLTKEKPLKCTRKRFLKLREEKAGLTVRQEAERGMSKFTTGKSRIYAIRDENGKDISNELLPKENHLDKE